MKPNNDSRPNFCGRTRREFLWQTGAGFTGVALAGMLGVILLVGLVSGLAAVRATLRAPLLAALRGS